MGLAAPILVQDHVKQKKRRFTSIGKKNINGSPNNNEKIETEVIGKYDHFMWCRENNDTSEHLPLKPHPLTSSMNQRLPEQLMDE